MAELLQEERLEKGSEGTCDLKLETLSHRDQERERNG